MFRIGLPEILLIAFIAVVFLHPREFPAIFRKIGRLVRQMKEMRDSFTRSIQEELGPSAEGERFGAKDVVASSEEPPPSSDSTGRDEKHG